MIETLIVVLIFVMAAGAGLMLGDVTFEWLQKQDWWRKWFDKEI